MEKKGRFFRARIYQSGDSFQIQIETRDSETNFYETRRVSTKDTQRYINSRLTNTHPIDSQVTKLEDLPESDLLEEFSLKEANSPTILKHSTQKSYTEHSLKSYEQGLKELSELLQG